VSFAGKAMHSIRGLGPGQGIGVVGPFDRVDREQVAAVDHLDRAGRLAVRIGGGCADQQVVETVHR